MAAELFPIIATTDLERSLRFYRDLLGGTIAYEFPGPDGSAVYVGVDLGRSHLGIGHDPAAAAGGTSVSLWVYTNDCDALIERLRAAGSTVLEGPADQPWGERVGRVADPDGIAVHIATRPR
jgi:lactoylglutathione lyase